jgi:protein SCO1/2
MNIARILQIDFLSPRVAVVALCLTTLIPAWADAQADAHDAHHLMIPPKAIRGQTQFTVPDIKLVRADGHEVRLKDEIDDGRPVVVDFIYTTCTAVCPVSSQVFAELDQRLGDAQRVHLVSVSIDPEEDTPERMRKYAVRFDASARWNFYTGTLEASETVQRAFHVFRGTKMLHEPTTLVRIAPGQPWVRFDGFVTPSELMGELNGRTAVR